MSYLMTGDIFNVEKNTIHGYLNKYGITKGKRVSLPKGYYYVIGETSDKKNFIISDINYLKGGFYTLGKINIYTIPKREVFDIKTIDKVPQDEVKEVYNFIEELNNKVKNKPL